MIAIKGDQTKSYGDSQIENKMGDKDFSYLGNNFVGLLLSFVRENSASDYVASTKHAPMHSKNVTSDWKWR